MKKIIIASLSSILFAATGARAEGVAAGLRIGTLGPGAEAVGFLTSNLNLRVTGNYVAFGFYGRVDTVNYDAHVRMSSLQGLLDWHPSDGNFRITGGVVLNNNKVRINGTPTDPTAKIGDNSYPSDAVGTLHGEASFDMWDPYLGIGYGNAVADDTDLSFSFDIGVMYQGDPGISLSSNGAAAGDPAFQADLAKERQKVQNFANKIKFYPVISFGICYYFW